MRWVLKKKSRLGDKRDKLKFAFLPVLLEGDVVVWLEWYVDRYEYQKVDKIVMTSLGPRKVETAAWILLERRSPSS